MRENFWTIYSEIWGILFGSPLCPLSLLSMSWALQLSRDVPADFLCDNACLARVCDKWNSCIFASQYLKSYRCRIFIVWRSNDFSVESCVKLHFVFGTVRVQISVRRQTILTEVFREFIQSSQFYAERVTSIMPWPISYSSLFSDNVFIIWSYSLPYQRHTTLTLPR